MVGQWKWHMITVLGSSLLIIIPLIIAILYRTFAEPTLYKTGTDGSSFAVLPSKQRLRSIFGTIGSTNIKEPVETSPSTNYPSATVHTLEQSSYEKLSPKDLFYGNPEIRWNSYTASSYHHVRGSYCGPDCAVIIPDGNTFKKGAKCYCSCWHEGLVDKKHWIQVDLGKTHIITSVGTLGRFEKKSKPYQFTSSYRLSVLNASNPIKMLSKLFQGNSNHYELVWRHLDPSLAGRYVRLTTEEFNGNNMCMSWELRGYPVIYQ